jgi:uncharacterized protein YndB with AHSA1/START domain
MASVANTITIHGPIAPVFDLVTTARFWPKWHPATLAVGGVTERPYQLGDAIHERGKVGNVGFQVVWTVTEHQRPSRVVFQCAAPPARIIYTFEPRGAETEFRRELEYSDAVLAAAATDPVTLQRLMHAQSEEALGRVKELVEAILRQETLGLPSTQS